MGRRSTVGIAGHPQDRMIRYAAAELSARAALMRHFLPAARAPGALARRMQTCSMVGALVARLCAPQRLASANARALSGAVDIAVIAALADAHLHPAALTVVEPIGRLDPGPQRPLPKRWTAPGKAGIKGLRIACPQVLRTEGPGL